MFGQDYLTSHFVPLMATLLPHHRHAEAAQPEHVFKRVSATFTSFSQSYKDLNLIYILSPPILEEVSLLQFHIRRSN